MKYTPVATAYSYARDLTEEEYTDDEFTVQADRVSDKPSSVSLQIDVRTLLYANLLTSVLAALLAIAALSRR